MSIFWWKIFWNIDEYKKQLPEIEAQTKKIRFIGRGMCSFTTTFRDLY